MNVVDNRLGYTKLRVLLDGKWTVRYEYISDVLISIFWGVI
jgi:hypothetical protein